MHPRRRPVLKPLTSHIPVRDEVMIAMMFIIQTCVNLLKRMNGDDVKGLFTQVSSASGIQYRVLGRYAGRLIVFVESVFVDDVCFDVKRAFFQSSGASRGISDIKGLWFPCVGIVSNPFEDRIIKMEDADILFFEDRQISDEDKVKRAEAIGVYGRFITELNAIASKALTALTTDNPVFDGITEDLVLCPDNDFDCVTVLDRSYVSKYASPLHNVSLS